MGKLVKLDWGLLVKKTLHFFWSALISRSKFYYGWRYAIIVTFLSRIMSVYASTYTITYIQIPGITFMEYHTVTCMCRNKWSSTIPTSCLGFQFPQICFWYGRWFEHGNFLFFQIKYNTLIAMVHLIIAFTLCTNHLPFDIIWNTFTYLLCKLYRIYIFLAVCSRN